MKNGSKAAFVAIVGRPNVGKSSILNRIIGQKVSIVSPRPQTTRTRIMGVLTEDNVQLVFTDTPGMHLPRTRLGNYMVNEIDSTIGDVDFCILVVEEKGLLTSAELKLIEHFKKKSIPAILVINKIDRLNNKELVAARIAEVCSHYEFEAVIPLSAATGDGIGILKQELFDMAEPSPHFFPDDTLTDQPERVLAAEIIRESALKLLSEEVPHGLAIDIESMKDRTTVGSEDIVDLMATIYCEKSSHKGIIIGKKGDMLKRIGQGARIELERVFGVKFNLTLWVKVREDWRNSERNLRSFGFVSHDE